MKDLAIALLLILVGILSYRLYKRNQAQVKPPQSTETGYWLNRHSNVQSDISSEHLREKD